MQESHILATCELVHSFSRDEVVLKGISIQVERGSIYGFLGPNGAGKTTTLRLILGLLKVQKGSISVFGKEFSSNRVEVLAKIGSMIESPSIYGHLTASENLTLLQKIHRCPMGRISEVLELVGLANTRKKKAGEFSLGMKQRLSIAIALLHSPELLILDEPTNGLDPNGIIEMRELLRNLNREHGITILVSSHLLSEIDRLVTHVGIINKGEMMFQGTLDKLKEQQEQGIAIVLVTSDEIATERVLTDLALPADRIDGRFSLPMMPKEKVAEINRRLVINGIEVYELSVIKNDLERIFIDMVSD